MRRDGPKPMDALLVLAKASFGGRRRRSPVRIVVSILVLLLLVALPTYLLWPGPEQPPLLLASFDQVVEPGETITLCARLEPAGEETAGANVTHCRLYFHDLQSDWRMEATTDRDGMATAERSFAAADAPIEIIVRYPGDGARQPGTQAKSRVFVWAPEAGLFMVDVDSTLPDVDAENLWIASNLDIRPRSGAVDCLRAARARYRIGYLCAAADRPSRYNKLRTWLERAWAPEQEQVPDGPLLARSCRLPGSEAAEFLQTTLSDLRARFHGTLIGVTGDRDKAQLFHAAGWRAFLLDDLGDVPEGITAVKSWSELKQRLP
jgi:hypothetical protein